MLTRIRFPGQTTTQDTWKGMVMRHPLMRICALSLLLTSLSVSGAVAYDTHGVGGGGFLTSGAIHPSDPDLAVIGGDVCGVFVTQDFGLSWAPWIEGLHNPDDAPSLYVDDLVGVDYNGWSGFYAATRAGIYRAELGQPWEHMTTSEKGYRYKPIGTGFANRPDLIPFSTLDWDGANRLVAGAGQIRWKPNFVYANPGQDETANYPGLAALDTSFPGGSVIDVTDQWSVWYLDLDVPNAEWTPDYSASAPRGAVRDISIEHVSGVPMIAVATSQGVWVKFGFFWIDLSFVSGWPQNPDLGHAWSVHVTPQGALYTAFNYNTEVGARSGVYRLDLNTFSQWVQVGGHPGPPIPPSNEDMYRISEDTELIYLSVGEEAGQDRLYLGARRAASNKNVGLYVATVPHGYDGYHTTWDHVVYKDGPGPWSPGFDPGWETAFAPDVLFEPPVAPSDPQRSLAQFHVRVHTSSDGGDNWDQRYTIESPNPNGPGSVFSSRGFNELVIWGLDSGPNGNIITGAADFGVFRATDGGLDEFRWVEAPLGASGQTPGCDEAWQHGALYAHAAIDWRGSNEEILFVASANRTYNRPGKLFWVDPDEGWHNITCDLPDADRYIFHDFAVSPATILVAYEKHDQQVSDTSNVVETGVLRGTQLQYPCGGCPIPASDPGVWIWETVNQGLPGGTQLQPVHIIHNVHAPVMSARIGTGDGGLYALDGNTWVKLLPGATAPESQLRDFRSLTQSSNGMVIYAGTSGYQAGDGAVIKINLHDLTDPTDVSQWNSVLTLISDGTTFGFDVPFWRDDPYQSPPWDDVTAGNELTWIDGLAVYPHDDGVVYAGLQAFGAFPQEGVWRYDGAGWSQLPGGHGLGVLSLAIAMNQPERLVVGTQGQELYSHVIPPSSPGPTPVALPFKTNPNRGHTQFKMLGSGPNPSSGSTSIHFRTDVQSVRVSVYNAAGRRVREEVMPTQPNLTSTFVWDGNDHNGKRVPSGVYYARIRAGQAVGNAKLVLVR